MFPAIAVFAAHLSEGAKTLRSLREERITQKSSLNSKELVDEVVTSRSLWSQPPSVPGLWKISGLREILGGKPLHSAQAV